MCRDQMIQDFSPAIFRTDEQFAAERYNQSEIRQRHMCVKEGREGEVLQ